MRPISPIAVAMLMAGFVLSACSGLSGGTSSSTTASLRTSTVTPAAPTSAGIGDVRVVSADYTPGRAATVRVPPGSGPADVVVLVPGGSWTTADPTGLVPLAERLTAGGRITVTITYGTRSTGATFPTPVDDVACAVRWSVALADRLGRPVRRLVVAGHSAGGHLAALVALSSNHFGAACAAPPRAVDGLVGLAGVYRVAEAADVAAPLFTAPPDGAADDWRQAEPTWWLGRLAGTPRPRVLLVHGDADTAVPVSQTQHFAADLRSAGVDVTVRLAPGETHATVYGEGVAGPLIEDWLAG